MFTYYHKQLLDHGNKQTKELPETHYVGVGSCFPFHGIPKQQLIQMCYLYLNSAEVERLVKTEATILSYTGFVLMT